MNTAFIRRVAIRNYKSIAACQLDLEPLTFLVGPNGAGKSNFLDALRFVADSLRTSLDHALRDRGTIKEVRRRSGGHPKHFALRLDFALPDGGAGHYSFRVGAKPSRAASRGTSIRTGLSGSRPGLSIGRRAICREMSEEGRPV